MTEATQDHHEPAETEAQPLMKLLLDLGPLILFFAAYALTKKDIFASTGIFMVATAAVMIFSKIKYRAVSPMLWFSGFMVLVLGGLTIWLHDETFIKIKPTIYYAMVAGILAFGLWTKRPTLKLVLGSAYPGLTERGWTILTRNWALFFVILGVTNELVWRNFSTEFWLGYKFWGALPGTILFAMANIPMLMRHGMNQEAPLAEEIPPQG